jgi:hypothetical protein
MDLAEVIAELKAAPERSSWPVRQDQLPSFSKFGLYHHTFRELTEDQVREKFHEVRQWMRLVGENPGLNAAYLDTTTLYTEILWSGRESR